MKKKVIIIIAAVAVAVVAAIIGVTVLLGGLLTADTKNPVSSTDASSVIVSSEEADLTETSGGPATITIGSAEGAKGDIVKVKVDIAENPGFMAALMNFSYDKDALKYIGYEKGNVLSDYEFSSEETLNFICVENEDVKDNGTLFTLKFEILGDKGSDITLSTIDLVNYNEKDVSSTIVNGKVTVK